jgi:hypothetical protein
VLHRISIHVVRRQPHWRGGKPARQVAPWEFGKGVRRRGGGEPGAQSKRLVPTSAASSICRAALHWVVRRAGELLSWKCQRGLTSPEGIDSGTAGDVRHPRQPRRCPLRGRPRVQGHRHAAVTRCATSEGVTGGGQSALGVGLHAAEALTSGSLHQAVRGQGLRTEGPASQADSAYAAPGPGQRRVPLSSVVLSRRIAMIMWQALE